MVVGLLLAGVSTTSFAVGFRRLDRDIERGHTSEGRVFFRLPYWLLLPYERYPQHRRVIRLVSVAVGTGAAFIVAYVLLGT